MRFRASALVPSRSQARRLFVGADAASDDLKNGRVIRDAHEFFVAPIGDHRLGKLIEAGDLPAEIREKPSGRMFGAAGLAADLPGSLMVSDEHAGYVIGSPHVIVVCKKGDAALDALLEDRGFSAQVLLVGAPSGATVDIHDQRHHADR